MSKIPISECKQLSQKYDAPMVILFALREKGERFNVVSYGTNEELCGHAAKLAREIAAKILSGEVEP